MALQMTRSRALAEFYIRQGVQPSVVLAQESIEGQLGWLDHVPEAEFTPAERKRLLQAFRSLFGVLRPLTAKYID